MGNEIGRHNKQSMVQVPRQLDARGEPRRLAHARAVRGPLCADAHRGSESPPKFRITSRPRAHLHDRPSCLQHTRIASHDGPLHSYRTAVTQRPLPPGDGVAARIYLEDAVAQAEAENAGQQPVPFADAENPLMSQLAFLCRSVSPAVAAAAAQAALAAALREHSATVRAAAVHRRESHSLGIGCVFSAVGVSVCVCVCV